MDQNVRGMVTFRLGGTQDGVRVVGGISMGVVKLILRTLTAMDYQVSLYPHHTAQLVSVFTCVIFLKLLFRCASVFNKLECLVFLKAGLWFTPSACCNFSFFRSIHSFLMSCKHLRRRLFIWGARRGEILPEFPRPTHCFVKRSSLTINMPSATGQQIKYKVRECVIIKLIPYISHRSFRDWVCPLTNNTTPFFSAWPICLLHTSQSQCAMRSLTFQHLSTKIQQSNRTRLAILMATRSQKGGQVPIQSGLVRYVG